MAVSHPMAVSPSYNLSQARRGLSIHLAFTLRHCRQTHTTQISRSTFEGFELGKLP